MSSPRADQKQQDAHYPAERVTALKTLAKNGKSFYWASCLLGRQMAIDAAELYSLCRLLDDIADGGSIGAPRRRLEQDADPVAEAVGLETSGDAFKQTLATRSAEILKRVDVISGFYLQSTEPRSAGFQQTA